MKKMVLAVVVALMLVGCGDNTIDVVHYNNDHGSDIEILNMSGVVIASKYVDECPISTTNIREHSSLSFDIDRDIDQVIIRSVSYGRKTITVVDGQRYTK